MNGVLLTRKIKNLINKNKQKNISKENMYYNRLKTTTSKKY